MKRALVLALGLVVLLGSQASASITIVQPAYRFKLFRRDHSRIEVVSLVPGDGFALSPMMARPRFSGRRRTSDIARAHYALAAVNGDFRILSTNAPKHQVVIGGEIWTSGSQRYPGFVLAMNADSTQAWVRRPRFDVKVHQGGGGFRVFGWNAQQPAHGSVVAFTARGGGPQRGPDGRWPTRRTCSALLRPLAHPRGTERTYRVVRMRKPRGCDVAPIQPPTDHPEWVVLHGHDVRQLRFARLRISIDLGKGDRNILGGFPLLVRRGKNVGPNCAGTCPKSGGGPDPPLMARNPRTVLGVTRGCSDRLPTKCKLFLVAVDGRSSSSAGVRFPSMGAIMRHLGAYGAVNLDGGGSTTMWLRHRNRHCRHRTRLGCLMNVPPYGERSIQSAIGIVRTR